MLEIKVTLRVFSETHSLSQLIDLLGKPTKGYSKGDLHSRESKARERSFWSFQAKVGENENFEFHIRNLVNFIEKNETVFTTLQNECEIDLFCMLSSNNGQGGFTFPFQLAGELAKYQLNVSFDIYAE